MTKEDKPKKIVIKKIKKDQSKTEKTIETVTVEEESEKAKSTVIVEKILIQELVEEIPEQIKEEYFLTKTYLTESVIKERIPK